MTLWQRLCLLLILTTLGSCGFVNTNPTPSLKTIAAEHWREGDGQHPLSWASMIASEQLNALIVTAIDNNPDLRATAARWLAVQEQVSVARGSRMPSLDAALNKQRIEANNSLNDTVNGNLNISWELDLWGRLASGHRAARESAEQQALLYTQARYSLAARVTTTWLDAIDAKRQVALARQREANLEKSLQVINDGFNSGIRSALDTYSARAEYADARRNTANRQQQLATVLRSMALLLGQYPNVETQIPDQAPDFANPLPSSLNTDLLMRRPDLAAAERAVLAQQANTNSASTNRLPRISLSGSYGARNNNLDDVLSGDDLVWNALGGLTAPLFRGGALAGEQRRQQHLLRATIEDFKRTALNAFAETEQALTNEQLLSLQLAAAEEAAQASVEAQEQAFEQYLSGLVNLTTWLQTQRVAFDRSSQLIQITTSFNRNRIDLYLALGGDFATQDRTSFYAQ